MAINPCKPLPDREFDKFTENEAGEICVRTCGTSVPQGLSAAGKVTIVPVDDTAWVKVVINALSNRRGWAVQNRNGTGLSENPNPILVNFAPFAPTGGATGWVLDPGEAQFIDANDVVDVYVRAASGSFNIVFLEVA